MSVLAEIMGTALKGPEPLHIDYLFVRRGRLLLLPLVWMIFHCLKTFSGSANAEKFLQFVNQELVPILQPYDGLNGSSVVIMGKKNRINFRFV